jgi:hypothetical protein
VQSERCWLNPDVLDNASSFDIGDQGKLLKDNVIVNRGGDAENQGLASQCPLASQRQALAMPKPYVGAA